MYPEWSRGNVFKVKVNDLLKRERTLLLRHHQLQQEHAQRVREAQQKMAEVYRAMSQQHAHQQQQQQHHQPAVTIAPTLPIHSHSDTDVGDVGVGLGQEGYNYGLNTLPGTNLSPDLPLEESLAALTLFRVELYHRPRSNAALRHPHLGTVTVPLDLLRDLLPQLPRVVRKYGPPQTCTDKLQRFWWKLSTGQIHRMGRREDHRDRGASLRAIPLPEVEEERKAKELALTEAAAAKAQAQGPDANTNDRLSWLGSVQWLVQGLTGNNKDAAPALTKAEGLTLDMGADGEEKQDPGDREAAHHSSGSHHHHHHHRRRSHENDLVKGSDRDDHSRNSRENDHPHRQSHNHSHSHSRHNGEDKDQDKGSDRDDRSHHSHNSHNSRHSNNGSDPHHHHGHRHSHSHHRHSSDSQPHRKPLVIDSSDDHQVTNHDDFKNQPAFVRDNPMSPFSRLYNQLAKQTFDAEVEQQLLISSTALTPPHTPSGPSVSREANGSWVSASASVASKCGDPPLPLPTDEEPALPHPLDGPKDAGGGGSVEGPTGGGGSGLVGGLGAAWSVLTGGSLEPEDEVWDQDVLGFEAEFGEASWELDYSHFALYGAHHRHFLSAHHEYRHHNYRRRHHALMFHRYQHYSDEEEAKHRHHHHPHSNDDNHGEKRHRRERGSLNGRISFDSDHGHDHKRRDRSRSRSRSSFDKERDRSSRGSRGGDRGRGSFDRHGTARAIRSSRSSFESDGHGLGQGSERRVRRGGGHSRDRVSFERGHEEPAVERTPRPLSETEAAGHVESTTGDGDATTITPSQPSAVLALIRESSSKFGDLAVDKGAKDEGSLDVDPNSPRPTSANKRPTSADKRPTSAQEAGGGGGALTVVDISDHDNEVGKDDAVNEDDEDKDRPAGPVADGDEMSEYDEEDEGEGEGEEVEEGEDEEEEDEEDGEEEEEDGDDNEEDEEEEEGEDDEEEEDDEGDEEEGEEIVDGKQAADGGEEEEEDDDEVVLKSSSRDVESDEDEDPLAVAAAGPRKSTRDRSSRPLTVFRFVDDAIAEAEQESAAARESRKQSQAERNQPAEGWGSVMLRLQLQLSMQMHLPVPDWLMQHPLMGCFRHKKRHRGDLEGLDIEDEEVYKEYEKVMAKRKRREAAEQRAIVRRERLNARAKAWQAYWERREAAAKKRLDRLAREVANDLDHRRKAREDRWQAFAVQWSDGAWIDVKQTKPLKNVHAPDRTDRGTIKLRFIRATRGNVVRGLDLAVQQMSLGEVAAIKSRFDFSYGHYIIGGGGSTPIPPRANLVFTTQLLSINGKGLPPPPVRACKYSYRFVRRLWNRCRTVHRHKSIERAHYRLLRQEEQSRKDEQLALLGIEPLPSLVSLKGLRMRGLRVLRWLRVLPPKPPKLGGADQGDEEEEDPDQEDEDWEADEALDAFDRELEEDDERSAASLSNALEAAGKEVVIASAQDRKKQRDKSLKKLRTSSNKLASATLFGYRPTPTGSNGKKGRERRRADDESNSFMSSSYSGSSSYTGSSGSFSSRSGSSSHSGSGSGSQSGDSAYSRSGSSDNEDDDNGIDGSGKSGKGQDRPGSPFSMSQVPSLLSNQFPSPGRARRESHSNFEGMSELGDVTNRQTSARQERPEGSRRR